MAGGDIITTTPASNAKIVPFNVPIKLNLDKHNYNSWSSFLTIHLGSLGLKSHIEGTDKSKTDPEWNQQDDLVKVWILGTLNESLQDQVVTTPGNAKALWDHIKELFHDNKDARTITLDGELRSAKIGNLSINAYCTKIQGLVDRLKNLGEEVSDKNMVMYTINGLDDRFKGIVRIIRHLQPLPKFATARSMLLLEEASFNTNPAENSPIDSSSSSPTILMATKSDNKSNLTKPQSLPQICNHFNKGTCKFGDRCRFIHDHRNRSGLENNTTRNPNNIPFSPHPTSWIPPGYYPSRNNSSPMFNYSQPNLSPRLVQSQTPQPNQTAFVAQTHPSQPMHMTQQQASTGSILGPAPGYFPSQATSIPHAFSTMTLQDPTWNMDTGFLDSLYPPSM